MGGESPQPGHPLTLGTAGHIDHGKTALVRALSGVDTDRLEEERRRGISIVLGYAPLALPSGRRLSVVDVPGHERFVRTMVSGATGIDLYLMAIAADDGVMPQTREHAAILAGLGVAAGVVAVTRSDLADPERAAAQARELLGTGVEVVACSSRTGEGVQDVRAALDRVAARLAPRGGVGAPVLHVDRVFSVAGAGTVVTGTLWSGVVGEGEELLLLPAEQAVRVRSVEVHDERVAAAVAGQRVAVALRGVRRGDVRRGDVLAGADAGAAASFVLDVELGVRIEHGTRVTVHHGTREAPARVAWLGGRFHQLRCEAPLVARAGDRLVLRSIAPPDTLGGGVVLDPAARRHGPSRDLLARLERRSRGEPEPQPAPAARGGASSCRMPGRTAHLTRRGGARARGAAPGRGPRGAAGRRGRRRRARGAPGPRPGRARGAGRAARRGARRGAAARAGDRRGRGLGHARAPARRAGHEPQVRPGAARAPRRRPRDPAPAG